MNKGATLRTIAIFGLALLPTFAWAGTGDPGHKHKTFSAGTPGDPAKRARTIEVTMREANGSMSFAPDRIEVRQGEQIKFALKNAGTQDHEFMLATKEENVTHGKLMERFPEMEHDSVPVGLISDFKFTPLITPSKVNNPPFFLEEPGGRVVVKGPTWRATAWVTGLILAAVLLKVKGERRLKESSLGAAPKAMSSVAL